MQLGGHNSPRRVTLSLEVVPSWDEKVVSSVPRTFCEVKARSDGCGRMPNFRRGKCDHRRRAYGRLNHNEDMVSCRLPQNACEAEVYTFESGGSRNLDILHGA